MNCTRKEYGRTRSGALVSQFIGRSIPNREFPYERIGPHLPLLLHQILLPLLPIAPEDVNGNEQ